MLRLTSLGWMIAVVAGACTDGGDSISGSWRVGGNTGCDDQPFESDSVRVSVTQRTQFTGTGVMNYDQLVKADSYDCGEGAFTIRVTHLLGLRAVDVTVERLSWSDSNPIGSARFDHVTLGNDLGLIAFQ